MKPYIFFEGFWCARHLQEHVWLSLFFPPSFSTTISQHPTVARSSFHWEKNSSVCLARGVCLGVSVYGCQWCVRELRTPSWQSEYTCSSSEAWRKENTRLYSTKHIESTPLQTDTARFHLSDQSLHFEITTPLYSITTAFSNEVNANAAVWHPLAAVTL